MPGTRPEIILTATSGELLEVEALAYPEDTHLIVDPYTVAEHPQETIVELTAMAEAALPRTLGEIISVPAKGIAAKWLYRLVLLDFDLQKHCRAETVEHTLRELIRRVTDLKIQRLGLDRFEFMERCISAYRVLSCMCDQARRLKATGCSPPESLIFAVHKKTTMRHYQLALANLPRDDR